MLLSRFAIVRKAAINIGAQVFVQVPAFGVLWVHPEMELLDRMAVHYY